MKNPAITGVMILLASFKRDMAVIERSGESWYVNHLLKLMGMIQPMI